MEPFIFYSHLDIPIHNTNKIKSGKTLSATLDLADRENFIRHILHHFWWTHDLFTLESDIAADHQSGREWLFSCSVCSRSLYSCWWPLCWTCTAIQLSLCYQQLPTAL